MRKIISVVVTIFMLSACAHVNSVSRQESGSVIKVSEGIYRGPRLSDLNELKSLNIRTILNLEDNNEAIQKESNEAKRLGMVMINIPMSEISRPELSDLLKAAKIIEDPASRPVYVHCLHGRDRTGFVIAADKILYHSWPVEKAYQEALDNGHNRLFYDLILGWKESLRLVASAPKGPRAIP